MVILTISYHIYKNNIFKFYRGNITHNFCLAIFFLLIQVRATTHCIETYDIYQLNVSEMYELCSNKRSEILLVVRNVCRWNTECSTLRMNLLKLSLGSLDTNETRCYFSDQRITIKRYPRTYLWIVIFYVTFYSKVNSEYTK